MANKKQIVIIRNLSDCGKGIWQFNGNYFLSLSYYWKFVIYEKDTVTDWTDFSYSCINGTDNEKATD